MKLFVLYIFLLIQTAFSALPKHVLKQQQQENAHTNNGIIKITSKDEIPKYFNGEKNYYLIIKLDTATDNESSVTSLNNDQFSQAYHRISNHVSTTYPNLESIFFLEFTDNENYLSNLNLDKTPQMWIYPPTNKIYYPDSMSGNPPKDGRIPRPLEMGFNSEHYQFVLPVSEESGLLKFDYQELLLKLAKLISSSCDIDIIINDFTDIEPIKVVTYCSLFYFIIKAIKKYGTSKWFYGALCIALCLVNISGLNFCLQKGVPLFTQNKQGTGVSWAHDGIRLQLGVEVFESVGAQLIIGSLLILLIEANRLNNAYKKNENDEVETKQNTPKKKDNLWWLLSLSLSMLLLVSYSVFLNLFVGYKDTGYPYNPIKII